MKFYNVYFQLDFELASAITDVATLSGDGHSLIESMDINFNGDYS